MKLYISEAAVRLFRTRTLVGLLALCGAIHPACAATTGTAATPSAQSEFANRKPVGVEPATVDSRAGKTSGTTVAYSKPDASKFRGKITANITAQRPDGTPGANLPFRLTITDPQVSQDIEIASGTLDAQGRVAIPGLSAGFEGDLRSAPAGSIPLTYKLTINNGPDTLLKLWTKTSHGTTAPVGPAVINARAVIPPGVGDAAPDIEVAPVFGGDRLKLSNLRGKVVYLDFWATWCGPCQKPMSELNQYWQGRKNDLGDKVAVIGVSIDTSSTKVASHVTKQGWTHIAHYWADANPGWQSEQSSRFAVRSIPTAFLIGKDGKILWRGNPLRFNKMQIENALATTP